MRHGIKDYIRDTTIHRLRYLIDGRWRRRIQEVEQKSSNISYLIFSPYRFWWEKVLWFIAVTIIFGFLDYILYQTRQDARENRLTTTLESIPVQVIPQSKNICPPSVFWGFPFLAWGSFSCRLPPTNYQQQVEPGVSPPGPGSQSAGVWLCSGKKLES